MGAELLPNNNYSNGVGEVKLDADADADADAPLILGLQPAALVDHVARVDLSLLDQIPGERGGSIPVLPMLGFLWFLSFC